MPWVKYARVVPAGLPGLRASAESHCPWLRKSMGETAGRFLVCVQEVHTYVHIYIHTYIYDHRFSRQDQIRAMSSHKPFPLASWALDTGPGNASSTCLQPVCFAAGWGTWVQLTSFVYFKPERAVCESD